MERVVVLDLGRIGRTNGYEGDWGVISSRDCEIWSLAETLISEMEYTYRDKIIRVSADLSRISDWYRKDKERGLYYQNPSVHPGVDIFSLWLGSEVTLSVKVCSEGEDEASNNYARLFAEKYLYDIFFIMNMSVPGSCEFLNVRFRDDDEFVLAHKGAERLHLSSYNFEEGYQDFLDGEVFSPIELPLEQVIAWYRRLNLGIRQKADGRAARAIYALLHICKSDIDINSVIWIFHALESVYITRVGEGVPGIVSRMLGLLDFEESKKKALTKHLRKLYDYRSAFVHGGYEIHHPMGSEMFDERLNDDRNDIYDGCRIGFNLVALSIQKMIQKGWFGLVINEVVVGLDEP